MLAAASATSTTSSTYGTPSPAEQRTEQDEHQPVGAGGEPAAGR